MEPNITSQQGLTGSLLISGHNTGNQSMLLFYRMLFFINDDNNKIAML
jgi:hypothetical protein